MEISDSDKKHPPAVTQRQKSSTDLRSRPLPPEKPPEKPPVAKKPVISPKPKSSSKPTTLPRTPPKSDINKPPPLPRTPPKGRGDCPPPSHSSQSGINNPFNESILHNVDVPSDKTNSKRVKTSCLKNPVQGNETRAEQNEIFTTDEDSLLINCLSQAGDISASNHANDVNFVSPNKKPPGILPKPRASKLSPRSTSDNSPHHEKYDTEFQGRNTSSGLEILEVDQKVNSVCVDSVDSQNNERTNHQNDQLLKNIDVHTSPPTDLVCQINQSQSGVDQIINQSQNFPPKPHLSSNVSHHHTTFDETECVGKHTKSPTKTNRGSQNDQLNVSKDDTEETRVTCGESPADGNLIAKSQNTSPKKPSPKPKPLPRKRSSLSLQRLSDQTEVQNEKSSVEIPEVEKEKYVAVEAKKDVVTDCVDENTEMVSFQVSSVSPNNKRTVKPRPVRAAPCRPSPLSQRKLIDSKSVDTGTEEKLIKVKENVKKEQIDVDNIEGQTSGPTTLEKEAVSSEVKCILNEINLKDKHDLNTTTEVTKVLSDDNMCQKCEDSQQETNGEYIPMNQGQLTEVLTNQYVSSESSNVPCNKCTSDNRMESHQSSSVIEKAKDSNISYLNEEPIMETSSLLNEMEEIISRRMSELGSKFNSDIDITKRSSDSNFPVPPVRHKKNRLKLLNSQYETMDFHDLNSSTSSLNSDSGIIIPPAVSKKPRPPKPKRNKLANRSQSDVSGMKLQAFQFRSEGDITQIDFDNSETPQDTSDPPKVPRRVRSVTVDFCVPANQHALLREIALADHKKEQEELKEKSSHEGDPKGFKKKLRPSRRAPPPPKQEVPQSVHEGSKFSVPAESRVEELNINDSDDADHEYLEIPESFMLPCKNNEEGHFISDSNPKNPPELPPRNFSNGSFHSKGNSVSAPGLSTSPQSADKSTSSQDTSVSPISSEFSPQRNERGIKPRPVSSMSNCSVLSSHSESGSMSQGSPEHDEISSSDSECEEKIEKAIKKKEKKIFYIAREIWSSEKVFVDVLKLLHQDFRDHILEAKDPSGKHVIPEEVLNKILNYLPQLYNLNQNLLQDLEERINNWDKYKQMADIFVKKGPFLKLYTSFIRDFSETNEIFDEACKRHAPFLNAVRSFEAKPLCAGLALKHYMLKPIQRIPQYQLLLQDYLKNLSENSIDYSNTLAALNIVREVADHANECMKQGDTVKKMLEIQKSLDGNFEIIKPGRILLKEGELLKLSRKEMQPRMFFLFNDVLLYTTPTTSGGYRLNNALTLAGMRVTKASLDEYKSEFNIITVTRSFTVEARTIEERDDWVKAIQGAIDQNTQRKMTFDQIQTGNQTIYNIDYELGSKAPIWIPDTRVTMCMICTCEFSITWRRHHCRACGRVLCANCSDNRAPLEYLRNKSARVCDECYTKLKTALDNRQNSSGFSDQLAQDVDGSFLSLGGLLERFQQIRKSSRFTPKFHIHRPARLKEVHANDTGSSNSGYLKIMKGKKWKKFWFVLKDKVLYTYKASNDMAAIESLPVVGYVVEKCKESYEGCSSSVLFRLTHKNRPALIFQAEDVKANERWIAAMEDASKA